MRQEDCKFNPGLHGETLSGGLRELRERERERQREREREREREKGEV
jgi:hypothetical protein